MWESESSQTKPSFLPSLLSHLALFTVSSLPLSGSSSSQLCSRCSRSCLSPSIPYALTRLDLKTRPVLPCYALPYGSTQSTDRRAPPSLPTYQPPLSSVRSGPWPSDFGCSTSALRLNSNQRSRTLLSNCVDFAIRSDSTHRRSSEPPRRGSHHPDHTTPSFSRLSFLDTESHSTTHPARLNPPDRAKVLHLWPQPGACVPSI